MSYKYRHAYRKKESDFSNLCLDLDFTKEGKKLVAISKDKSFRGFAYISDSIDAARLSILTEYNDRVKTTQPGIYQ